MRSVLIQDVFLVFGSIMSGLATKEKNTEKEDKENKRFMTIFRDFHANYLDFDFFSNNICTSFRTCDIKKW